MADYDNVSLFADDVPYTHRAVTILNPAADLKRGSVMGRITATGKWKLSASAAGDGSEVPRGILAFDIPNPAADIVSAIYDAGSFVSEKLTFGAGHTAASVETALIVAQVPIRLKSVGAEHS